MSPYDRALNYLTDLNVVELALTGKLGEIQSEKRRVGIFIEMYQRFSLDEPRESEQTGANGSPSAEVVPAAVESATAEGAPSPSAPHSPDTAPSGEAAEAVAAGESPVILSQEANEGGEHESVADFEIADPAQPQVAADVIDEPVERDSAQSLASVSAVELGAQASVAPPAQAEEGGATTPSSATLKDRILAAHAEHPDWNSSQLADHLGAKRSSVSAYCAMLGIHFPRGASPTPVPAVEKAPAWADRIEALLKEHPEWTSTDLSRELGITVEHVNSAARKRGIAIPRVRVPRRDEVLAAIDSHPDWTARQIAEVLGCDPTTVNSVAKQQGRTIRRLTPEERHVSLVQAAGKGGAMAEAHRQAKRDEPNEPAAEPKTQTVPPRVEPPRPVNDDEIIPPNRNTITKLKGKLFWLRNSEGEYLHRYCDRMTRNRKEAWTGTEAQILGCRRNFSIARDLVERPVEKEQVVA